MNLTDHFTLDELTASQLAVRRGIDNRPTIQIVRNLCRLAEALEQVRALVGKPLVVSSGYRCQDLNRWVGGSSTSAHTQGLAADINCAGVPPRELAKRIAASDIGFDQVIFEGTWVHFGLAAGAQRRQILTARFDGGRATYQAGIV